MRNTLEVLKTITNQYLFLLLGLAVLILKINHICRVRYGINYTLKLYDENLLLDNLIFNDYRYELRRLSYFFYNIPDLVLYSKLEFKKEETTAKLLFNSVWATSRGKILNTINCQQDFAPND